MHQRMELALNMVRALESNVIQCPLCWTHRGIMLVYIKACWVLVLWCSVSCCSSSAQGFARHRLLRSLRLFGGHGTSQRHDNLRNVIDDLDKSQRNGTEGVENQRNATDSRKDNADQRIVGGRPAAPGVYPSYVHTLEPFLCGGTLIHEDIVLTAAHCEGAFDAGVYIGGLERDGSDGTMLDVQAEFPHPDFDMDTQFNDIMLVKLTSPSSAPLGPLNLDLARPVENDVLTVIGFGRTSENGDTSPILLEVVIDAFSDDFCFDLYRYYDPMTMLCAGTCQNLEVSAYSCMSVLLMVCTPLCAPGSELGGRDSCQGDSGGPIYVAGLIQAGVRCSLGSLTLKVVSS
jgi:Trypsin